MNQTPTAEHKRLLLSVLLDLKVNGPREWYWGICTNVFYMLRDIGPEAMASVSACDDILEAIALTWPLYSGDASFPVPHETLKPVDAYLDHPNKWTGQYGNSRKAFLDFAIAALQKDTE